MFNCEWVENYRIAVEQILYVKEEETFWIVVFKNSDYEQLKISKQNILK